MGERNRMTTELQPGVPQFVAVGPCRSLPRSGPWMT
jgi:hypothetical protein